MSMLRTPLLLVLSLAALAAAQGSPQCSGEVVCCDKIQNAYDVPNIPATTGLSPASAANLGLVGSTCTTLTVIGLPSGKTCATSQLPVCCTDNNYNGTVSLGCGYINNNPMIPA